MTLEWIDPPRDWRDRADDVIAELRASPGHWARVRRNVVPGDTRYGEYLTSKGIEWRVSYAHRKCSCAGTRHDYYARAPKEA